MSEPDGPLGRFPFVFLSYDEPWADRHWNALKRQVPHAVRVHGVTGLDACHKAAAGAVTGDWIVTVDADTRLEPSLMRTLVPGYMLTEDWRLDWLSRNAVNGLWSGNGSVKLWPRVLLEEMRTHEASEDGSLDHDIGGIRPGRSRQFTRPERMAQTWPNQSPALAFRAGFREAVFLHAMASRGTGDWLGTEAARIIRIWCSLGRHALNGHWMVLGARMGLCKALTPGWAATHVNDYAWINRFWLQVVRPGLLRSAGGGETWNWARVENALAESKATLGEAGFALAEYPDALSQRLAEAGDLSPIAAPNRIDSLGYALLRQEQDAPRQRAAQEAFETAALLGHPAAFDNLGRMHQRGQVPDASPGEAAALFQTAEELGNSNAAGHLAELGEVTARNPLRRPLQFWPRLGQGEEPDDVVAPGFVAIDHDTTPNGAFAGHVPDLELLTAGLVLEYASQCPETGAISSGGVRVGLAEALRSDASTRLEVPFVLGSRVASPADTQGMSTEQWAGVSTMRPAISPVHAWEKFCGDLQRLGFSERAEIYRRARIETWGTRNEWSGINQGSRIEHNA